MAMIHVNRGATSLGAFSEEEVREGLRTGRFAATDIGWREGMATWQPLSQFPELGAAAPAAPPTQIGAGSTSETTAPRSGLPWENRQERGFFPAFIETLVMVLTKPGTAFGVMRTEGGLVHLSLMLVGGANKAFETTFRVISFSQGSTAPLQLVPCCGGFVALIWCLVANCIGVARAHEIDTGRATLAVLLPVIVCCGGGLFLLFMVGGLALLQHNASH